MAETTTAVAKTGEEKAMEFIPYGAQDKIKLTIKIIQNLVAVKTKKGATCSEQDAVRFMMMCQARRLNPFEGDAYLIGYDGQNGPSYSLITAHQAFLKRAELNPEYDGMKSGVIVKLEDGQIKENEGDFYVTGETVIGGWAQVFFKNRKQPMYKRVRMERFKKSFGIWVDDPAGMICKCAEADALRSSFPTMLGGLYLREEIVKDDKKVSEPVFTTPLITEKPPVAEAEVVNDTPDKKTTQIKAIRGLMAAEKMEEKALLNFLIEVAGADEKSTSLEEIPADTIEMAHDQWADLSNRIKSIK